MTKVFIDGREGTTGLRIHERLAARDDVSVIVLSDELRKDPDAKKQAMAEADITFLCLPDDAAREAVALAEGTGTTIIDASTAHRTAAGWVYGFPEIAAGRAEQIAASKRIAVPGCHASGFIALVAPLVAAGLVSKDARLSCFSLTGYSGGGKKMIAQYQSSEGALKAPRQYGLTQAHKHLKEMTAISGLNVSPAFCPIVGDFYSGMEVTVPLFKEDVKGGVADIIALYSALYTGDIVRFMQGTDESGFLSAGAYADRDSMEIAVFGNEDRVLLTARYDNLGKGASGAAVECMNLAMGVDAAKGLVL